MTFRTYFCYIYYLFYYIIYALIVDIKINFLYKKNIYNGIKYILLSHRYLYMGMLYVPGLVFLDSTENPDLCVYCDTAWPHICLPCLRSSGMYDTSPVVCYVNI